MNALETLLSIEDFAVSAGGVSLIQAFSLEVRRGKLVAVLGVSGCGKTTLLRAIAGLIDADRGAVRLKGRVPEEIGWPVYRRGVAHVEQKPVMLDATVRENLARPFAYRTARTPFPEGRAAELLGKLGLYGIAMDANARDLSGGQQQRVSLARALLIAPDVALLDEPTGSLDEESAARAEDLIRAETRERGMAALVVTHDKTQANRWCDRVINLEGRLAPGNPALRAAHAAEETDA